MGLRPWLKADAVSLRGGATTRLEKINLKPGQFSMVQNLRPRNPSFDKRLGCRKQHVTADGTNQVRTIYQFKKTRPSETQLFAQMSDGDVLTCATGDLPPAVGAGVFGTEIHDGGATGQVPASWSNLNDTLLFSQASDQHQLYGGTLANPTAFVVVKGTTDLTTVTGVIESGFDYSDEVIDGDAATYADLSSLDTKANGDGFFICTPIPAASFTFTIGTTNSNSAVLSGYYWKNDSTWANLTITDGTIAPAGKTLGQTGTITYTLPTTIQEKYLFGKVGYWYLFTLDAALDASTTITGVTYSSDWAPLVNRWDGVTIPAVEVLVEGTSTFETFAFDSVDLGSLASGKKIYIASPDPIEGIYIDPGDTPNTTASLTITSLKYWNGTAWTSVGTPYDGTGGMANPAWITFPRQSAVQPLQFESSQFLAYWYELIWDDAISADVIVNIEVMPYYDVADFGKLGQCSVVWKDRGIYSFADKFQEYVYISATDAPSVLNGDDFQPLEIGDGRPHKITAMRKYYNDLAVWQEEKGVDGGTLTIIQGYSPATFGKLVVSTKVGTMNAKSVDVVENVALSTKTDESLKTLMFCLSRYGVYICDGRSISFISDPIQNYFYPENAECIRRGYEQEMWLKYDPVYNLVRVGLVSGGSATTPNVFPVYDVQDHCWYFDVLAQEFSTVETITAASGDIDAIQLAGGVDDGQVYQINYGTADISTAIDSFLTVEFPGKGQYLDLLEFSLQCRAQSAGDITVNIYGNEILKVSGMTLSMIAEVTNQVVRRHWRSLNVVDQLISIKIQNSSTTNSMVLETLGLQIKVWEGR